MTSIESALFGLRAAQGDLANKRELLALKIAQRASADQAVHAAEGELERFRSLEEKIAEHFAGTIRDGANVLTLPEDLEADERRQRAAESHARRVRGARDVLHGEATNAEGAVDEADRRVHAAAQIVVLANLERICDELDELQQRYTALRVAASQARVLLGSEMHPRSEAHCSQPWIGPSVVFAWDFAPYPPNPWRLYRDALVFNSDAPRPGVQVPGA